MIWLIGNRGMLGQELSGILDARGMKHLGSDREVDIRDLEALRAFAGGTAAKGEAFDWVINCSAYTNVDKAEEEEDVARAINAAGAGNIAAVAAELGARMIHISTDYVFRGDGNKPCLESDPMDPAGAYGRTKAEGEQLVAAACPAHFILRTAWLYGKYGPNFVYTMLRLMQTKDSIKVVQDQKGTPTWAFDLATAICDIIISDSDQFGTYHFTNEGQTDWHGFATLIEKLGREYGILNRACEVQAITSDQYPSKVKRPAWSVLSKEKIADELGIEPPQWEESLRAFLSGIAEILRRQRPWRAAADYDMKTVEVDMAGGQYRAALFWCHQALEKYMKALLEFHKRPGYSHELPKLAAALRLDLSDAQKALLEGLGPWYLDGRDGSGPGDVDKAAAEELAAGTRDFAAWLLERNKLPLK